MEWAGSSEDLTDQDNPTSDSNLLAQDTFVKPEETVTLTTTENNAVALDDKPLTSTDDKALNKSTLSGSDDSTIDVVAGHSMNREELMRAVFEDDTSNNTKQVTGQNNNAQENIFGDSHFNPDDWVEILNDELI